MLQPLLDDANWVKLNEAELAILCLEAPGLKHAMLTFCVQFGLEMLVVTCVAKGAVACDRQQHFVTVQPPTSNTVVDTVSAADAFAALLLLGLKQAMAFRGDPGAGARVCMHFCRQTRGLGCP
jgi:fructokinase